MVLLLLFVVGFSAKTGYFGHGLKFLFTPNFSALTPNSMLIALGHAFFTLSLATGSIMVYGAYVPRPVSIPKAAFFIAFADTAIALIAGLAIFPIVFANGLEPGAGPGLLFKTLPIAFGKMADGRLFATIFFVMIVFAAFTSAISLLEPSVAWLIQKFKISRRRAAVLAGTAVWISGLGTVISFNVGAEIKIFGKNIFDALDYLTANIMLPLAGLCIAIFTVYFMQRNVVRNEFNGYHKILFKTWYLALSTICPLLILLVFLNFVGVINFIKNNLLDSRYKKNNLQQLMLA